MRPGTTALALVLATWVAPGCGGEAERPSDAGDGARASGAAQRNVILVTIDTLRADALGAYGSPRETSPNLDRLAAGGVLFEQCTASAPSTLPSHASILTARRPYNHGARANAGFALPGTEVTLAERLQREGFATGAEVASLVLGRRTRIDQGFDRFRVPPPRVTDVEGLPAQLAAARTLGTRIAENVTAHGIDFLRDHRDEPFFLWLHYYDPHAPYTPPEPYRSRFRDSAYHGEVAYVDAQVGRFLEALKELGLAERTLLVITADHGEGLGEHGEQTHLFFVYQSTMRVPCILAGPDLPEGRRIETPVRTIDLAPTILDWLGLGSLPTAEGASLLPLLRSGRELDERLAYGESIDLRTTFGTSVLRFVRNGDWKYIHKVEPELYDLAEDPDELRDRSAERPEVVARLRDALRELLAEAAPAREEAVVDIDAETARQLGELGYVTGGAVPEWDELDGFAVSGRDPAQLAGDVERFGIAVGYLDSGDPQSALPILRDLVARHPQGAVLLGKEIDALLSLERWDEAREALRRAVERAPEQRPYHETRVQLELAHGDPAGARRALRDLLARWPCDLEARTKLASLASEAGDTGTQVEILEAGMRGCDPTPTLLNELAYVLVTAPDAELRDASRAVQLAQRAVETMDPLHPFALDTLAAAHAEAGDWEEALAVSRRALALAERQGLPASALDLLRGHLAQFEAGRPLRAAGSGDGAGG